MIRVPCKYQQTLVSHGLNWFNISSIHRIYILIYGCGSKQGTHNGTLFFGDETNTCLLDFEPHPYIRYKLTVPQKKHKEHQFGGPLILHIYIPTPSDYHGSSQEVSVKWNQVLHINSGSSVIIWVCICVCIYIYIYKHGPMGVLFLW